VKVSVVVCTYEAPRELDLVLAALSRQTRRPDEILVADDGSKTPTREVVDAWRPRIGAPLHHVWQSDVGYRKARIVNEVVRRSHGDHLIMLDGDSFPHRSWVEDHVSLADGRSVLCGRRVKLGPAISPTVTREDVLDGRFDSVFSARLIASALRGDTQRLSLGVRLPMPIVRLVHPRPRKLMGVNFSLPRATLYAVNGFNEAWTVYGHEDRDLELRLLRAGHPFRALLNRAVVFHVWHKERERTDRTRELLRAAEESDAVRCEVGLLGGPAFDPDR
jgi:glycosyltransferase involved in cell wall biosynthesis